MVRVLVGVVLSLTLMTGCVGGTRTESGPVERASPSGIDEELRDELVTMEKQDQDERTGGEAELSDTERTARLEQIIAEHGWPTWDLVGTKGEEAAWVIAQHSDLDPEFQARALELLRDAVADGQASPGNLAYLEDRVRAGRGEPQLYGTQVGCTRGGEPGEPEIEDPAGLDERRAEAGLPPYTRYLHRMARLCRGS